jgi:molecular chaperone GrpE
MVKIFSKRSDDMSEEEKQNAEQMAVEESSTDEKTALLEAEVAKANDLLLRRTAELENMRRRHDQERMQLIFEANKRLITELLPTVDDLERTLSFIKPEEKNPLVEGLELVYRNFIKVLERHNVTAIASVGEPFDVNLHDALMEEERTDLEPGTVTIEVQKGYRMNDTILRHAKVIVAKSPEKE